MKKMMLTAVLGIALASPAFAAKADRRERRQQDRIEQGVNNGTLDAKETMKLEKQEGKVKAEVARDRAANGGHMTPAERTKVNREQNKLSREIYKDKHNEAKPATP